MNSFAYLLKFSYRNLFRVPKRTLIMILSLSFGCGFIIWDLNFANSGSKEIMKDFLTQYAGSIAIAIASNTALAGNFSGSKTAIVSSFLRCFFLYL